MTYDMAVTACEATAAQYYSVEPIVDAESRHVGALVVVISPAEATVPGTAIVNVIRGQLGEEFGDGIARPAQDAPPEVRELQFQPYDGGFWHQPLQREIQDVLRRFGRSM